MIKSYGYSRLKSNVILLIFIALFSFSIRAAEKTKNEDKLPSPKEEFSPFEEMLIEKNKAISSEIDTAADKIDVMLAGKRVTDEKNKTQVKIESAGYWGEGGEPDLSAQFGVALRLPNLEKKWQLTFTSYDENEENRGVENRQFRREAKERNYGAGIAFFNRFGKVNTSFQPRLELKDPLDMSYVLKFEPDSQAEPGQVHVLPRLEFFAQPDKGVGVFNSYNLIWPLNIFYSITYLQEFEYEDADNKFTSNNALSLIERVTDRGSFSYSIAATSNNREAFHLQQYGFAVNWLEIAYEETIEYSLGPTWDFIKENHFKGVVGFRVTLNFMF